MEGQSTGAVTAVAPSSGLTTTGVGQWTGRYKGNCSVQVVVEGVGQVDATVKVEVSNDGLSAVNTPAATVTLSSATGRDSDGFLFIGANWKYIRLNVTNLTGTNAKVTGLMGA